LGDGLLKAASGIAIELTPRYHTSRGAGKFADVLDATTKRAALFEFARAAGPPCCGIAMGNISNKAARRALIRIIQPDCPDHPAETRV